MVKFKKTIQCVLSSAVLVGMTGVAVAGVDMGNGTGNSAVAYSESDLRKLEGEFNLDCLKLTPQEVAKREAELQKVYKYYQTATVSRFADVLDSYGLNVFRYRDDGCDFKNKKAGTMACFVQYLTNYEVSKTSMANANIPDRGLIKTSAPDQSSLIVLKLHRRDKNDEKWYDEEYKKNFLFMIGTKMHQYKYSTWTGGLDSDGFYHYIDTKVSTLLSSEKRPVYDFPVMDHLLAAINESQLKAVDATVVFLAGKSVLRKDTRSEAPFEVVYPPMSRVAPVPQPIIFIGTGASKGDLVDMLEEHAPKIHAYNQLFNARLLPEVEDIERELQKYPELHKSLSRQLAELERQQRDELAKEAAQEAQEAKKERELAQREKRQAMYEGYLSFIYKLKSLASGGSDQLSNVRVNLSAPALREAYVKDVVRHVKVIQQNTVQVR